jgi:hypothetical protein
MRLLTKAQSRDEQARLVALLESRGIPIYAATGWTARNPFLGGVFVCIDSQYDDAVALLRDEEHVVADPVDVAEFWKKAPATLPTILKGALIVLGVLVVVTACVVALRRFVP